MKKIIYLITFLCLSNGCNSDDPGDVILSAEELNIVGTKYAESKNNFTATYTSLHDSLVSKETISIIAEVDLAANARSVGRVVDPSKIIFFMDPVLETPLLQKKSINGIGPTSKDIQISEFFKFCVCNLQ